MPATQGTDPLISASRRVITALLLTGTLGAAGLAAQSGEPTLSQAAGREVFEQSCSGCHALGTAIGKRRTSDEWAVIIRQMIGYGAQFDDAQVKTIHDYLAANYAPQAAVAAAAVQGQGQAQRNGQVSAAPTPYAPPVTPAPQPAASYPRPTGPNQWPAYGGGNANTNFSPLAQITPRNVGRLKPAWVYRYGAGQSEQGDQGLDVRFEVTPLLIGGVMYISTPSSPLKPDLKSTVTAGRTRGTARPR